MKLYEPIGKDVIGPFLIRVVLGGYFLIAGLIKIDYLEAFVQQVKGFELLPGNLSAAYATLLPFLEVLTGVFLIGGFWTTLAAGTASLLLISFIIAFGILPYAGTPFGEYLFNKDLILLAASVSLMYTGGGALSIDRFRRG
jgi:uncharacterized membrane protein YphA (DoxX/SURF4 family)